MDLDPQAWWQHAGRIILAERCAVLGADSHARSTAHRARLRRTYEELYMQQRSSFRCRPAKESSLRLLPELLQLHGHLLTPGGTLGILHATVLDVRWGCQLLSCCSRHRRVGPVLHAF